jgi:ribosomal protein S18 acetylase RimI-like enzyme
MPIRLATPSDAGAVAHIHVITWRAAYRGQIPDAILDGLDVARRTSFWQERLSKGDAQVFVSEDNATISGFCDLVPSRDKDADPAIVAEIAAIYVLPEYWRKGAGRALCTRALAEARARKCCAVTLWVLASNTRAGCFYEAMGFKLDGVTKTNRTPDATELCEVRYRLSLNPLALCSPPRPD